MFIQVCRYPHEDVHAALFRKGKKGKQKGKRKKKNGCSIKGSLGGRHTTGSIQSSRENGTGLFLPCAEMQ